MKVVKKVENTFNLLSNGQVQDFVTFLMSETKLGKSHMLPAASKAIMDPVIKNILSLYENTPSNKRGHVLSLVANEFTYNTLLSFGFNITQGQFDWARKINKSGQASMLPYKRTMPKSRMKTSPLIQEQIVEILLENSYISSKVAKKYLKTI